MAPQAHAGIADTDATHLRAALITYGPGQLYWERFGHDAIELEDTVSGEKINFNYGVFDFEQKNFLLNFARGHMLYTMDAVQSPNEMRYYQLAGRSIVRQELNLTRPQLERLRGFLLDNYQPENRAYRYDYFTRNCATRVRDAINLAMGGKLKAILSEQPGSITYRSETRRLLAHMPALMLVIDLGLSSYADQPLNAWQASFIPMQLMQQLENASLVNPQAIIETQTTLASASHNYAASKTPVLVTPMLIIGLIMAAVILLLDQAGKTHRSARIAYASLSSLWLLLAGIAGLLMLALWLFTAHQAAWANQNLLLLSPVALVLVLVPWHRHPARWQRLALYFLALCALLAPISKLILTHPQANTAWIAMSLPITLALALSMLAKTRLNHKLQHQTQVHNC